MTGLARLSAQPVLAALGLTLANADEPVHVLEVYVVDRTKAGDEVTAYTTWVRLITQAVSELTGGGATVLPEALGYWQGAEEHVTVVRGYATRAQLIDGGPRLRQTLAQYRREAEQAVVAVTLDGVWLRLKDEVVG